MFDGTIALDGATGTEASFKLIGQDGQDSTRIDIASTPAEPRLMLVKHTTSGKLAAAVDRHLVSFTLTKNDGTGTPRQGVVNVTLAQPRSAITNAEMKDLLAYAIDFLSGGGFSDAGYAATTNVDGLLLGES